MPESVLPAQPSSETFHDLDEPLSHLVPQGKWPTGVHRRVMAYTLNNQSTGSTAGFGRAFPFALIHFAVWYYLGQIPASALASCVTLADYLDFLSLSFPFCKTKHNTIYFVCDYGGNVLNLPHCSAHPQCLEKA